MASFRDLTVVVIEVGRDTLRAGIGLHELLQRPSVDIPARVGLPRSALANGSFISGTPATSHVKDYLVGQQLDDALANGQDVVISYPFADGKVRDWIQAEALWKHMYRRLGIKRAQNESPALISIFPGLSRSDHEQIAQIFFERLNFAALSIVERPVAQLYAAAALTGIVVDLNRGHTDITPIYDCIPLNVARGTLPIGTDDCERYLASLLRQNTSVMSTLASAEGPALQSTLVRLARHVWQTGLVRVAEAGTDDVPEEGVTDIAAVLVAGKEKAVIDATARKKANAKASAAELARAKEIEALDLVTVTFEGKEISVGKERHRFCEPLFQPALVQELEEQGDEVAPYAERVARAGVPSKVPSLQELVGHAVSIAEVDQRQYLYQGLLVSGSATQHIRGIGAALSIRLAPYILSNPEQQNDVQPKTINVLRVPEYFAEYRETGNGYAAFLGSQVVAKVTFNDLQNKNFVSKPDYTTKGPKAIIEMSAALL